MKKPKIIIRLLIQVQQVLNTSSGKGGHVIGLLQLAITWYKIGHAGGQAHHYSRYGTFKQRDLNQ